LQAIFLGPLISLLTQKRIRIVALRPNKDLNRINELFQAGKLQCVLDGPFDLRDVPEAIRLFGAGRHKGKVVISVATPQQES
jgi:NADPH:quinone reductase-like Zn-dependent oxidoreductase